jgi:1-aminocyclopropane-1-carboxylate deaminase
LEEAKQLQKKTIVTFGGAYSNHIIATAAACELNGFKSIGIIRGEEAKQLSPTLLLAKEFDMQLIFVSRENYKEKKIWEDLLNEENLIIEEGGYGEKGAEGAANILDLSEKENFTHICCAVGTGTMLAGLIKASLPGQFIIGISVMKNNFELFKNVSSLLNGENNFEILHNYHFGGYAKYKPQLIRFMNEFYIQTQIPSDFVYTGKLFFAVNDLINKNYFPNGTRLLVIHSGGLQGNASLEKGMLIF